MILVVIGVSVAGFFTSEISQKYYKYEVEEKLKNTAKLIEYQISNNISSGVNLDYNKLAKSYADVLNQDPIAETPIDKINSRVTFIDFKGNVLGESETDYHIMENHLNRKEIIEAISGKIGEDIRPSQTLKIDFLYIAVPLKQSNIIIRVSVPLIQLKEINNIMIYYSLAGILAGLFITSLLALKFSASITEPVSELISVSQEISQGNYSRRVHLNTHDELGQLATTFNAMGQKLEKTVADLIDKNVKVDSIINSMIVGIIAVDSDYKIIFINSIACNMFDIQNENIAIGSNFIEQIRNNKININLKDTVTNNNPIDDEIYMISKNDIFLRYHISPIKANDSKLKNSGAIVFIQDITNIRKLEQIRTDFVANVTHELKTPLTSIRGFVETLRGGAINDKAVADKFLEIVDIEAERLYMLINDILQLSEIESGLSDPYISRFNLNVVIQEVISMLDSHAKKKGISLKYEIDESITMEANSNRIKQLLINLIDNSINYNVENGSVFIKAYKESRSITISVEDTGIGIANEHIHRIFERFYRVDKGRSRSTGGTGLGLSIVKHIVNLYSGDIQVSSEHGQGTKFLIHFPL